MAGGWRGRIGRWMERKDWQVRWVGRKDWQVGGEEGLAGGWRGKIGRCVERKDWQVGGEEGLAGGWGGRIGKVRVRVRVRVGYLSYYTCILDYVFHARGNVRLMELRGVCILV